MPPRSARGRPFPPAAGPSSPLARSRFLGAWDSSMHAQCAHDFQDRSASLEHGNAIDQRRLSAEALARFVEPRLFASRKSASATLCQHITHRMGQRGRLGKLLADPQHGRSFAEISGQALGRRTQTGLDRLDAVGQAAQPNPFCATDRNQQRPALREVDVVVILSAVQLCLGRYRLMDRVDAIAARQAMDGAKTELRVEDGFARQQGMIPWLQGITDWWTKTSSPPSRAIKP